MTRNNNNSIIEKQKFMVMGHHSAKKRRQGSSSKERQSFQNGSINSLLDFSNRQSNKNIFQNINPYLFDVSSGKKSIKKKSESIDFVRFIHLYFL
jgi:hypothetical protein